MIEIGGDRRVGTRSSYTYQLEAFAAAVHNGATMPTDADDAVITMGLIDDCYRAVGFDPGPSGSAHRTPG